MSDTATTTAAADRSQAPGNESRVMVVSGASGFIGSHLVDALLDAGHPVVGIDRREPHDDVLARLNLADALRHPSFTLHSVDLLDADLEPHLHGVDCVFHLAAVDGVRRSWQAFPEYLAANVAVTQRLVSACERAGVRRLVYASSSDVYGSAYRPSRESDPARPVSPYGVTKLAGELLCLAHAARADSRLTVVALRYFTVYGPRQRPDMAVSRLLTAALNGRPYPLFGDGTQRREFTYVSDAVDATIAASWLAGQHAVINVGGGTSHSMIHLIDVVRELTGRPVAVMALATEPGDVAAMSADLTTARIRLGYEPKVSLRAGVAAQLLWLQGLAR